MTADSGLPKMLVRLSTRNGRASLCASDWVAWITRQWRPLAIVALILLGSVVAEDHSRAQGLQPGITFRDCPDCPEMVVIPGGSFLMGSTESDTKRDLGAVPAEAPGIATFLGITDHQAAQKFMAYEHPQHRVTISKALALGKYPVTVGEFAVFVRETGYSTGSCYIFGIDGRRGHTTSATWSHPGFRQTERDPVVCVTWDDAKAYLAWLDKKTDSGASGPAPGHYELPSEAEWEYAARAGSQTARWWGNDMVVGKANCYQCNNNAYPQRPISVGTFPANPFGLYDMLGNASQWTKDCWVDSYDKAPVDGSARTDGDCAKRVERGGSGNGLAWVSRSASRSAIRADLGYSDLGFRVKKSIR